MVFNASDFQLSSLPNNCISGNYSLITIRQRESERRREDDLHGGASENGKSRSIAIVIRSGLRLTLEKKPYQAECLIERSGEKKPKKAKRGGPWDPHVVWAGFLKEVCNVGQIWIVNFLVKINHSH